MKKGLMPYNEGRCASYKRVLTFSGKSQIPKN